MAGDSSGVMKCVSVLFLGVATLIFGTGVIVLSGSILIKSSYESTNGTVVSEHLCNKSRNRGGDTYSPVIDFSVDGKKYEFTSTVCTNADSLRKDVGDEVEVLYDPNDPEGTAVDGSFATLFIVPILMISFSILFCCIFFSIMSKNRQQIETPKPVGP